MGFLSKLLNPKSAIANPGGALLKKVGIDTPDPGGDLLQKYVPGIAGSPAGSGAADPATQADPSGGMANYYGDQNDPAYGSLTQPFDVEQFYNYADPGYAFQLQQGTQGLQNSAAAGSGAMSGAALKDLIGYNQQYAGSAYGDAFNRYQTQQGNIFSRLSSIAQLGQNAASGVGAQGTQLAGQAGQSLSNAGTAAGSGIVGAGNAISNGTSNYWLWKNFANQPGSGGVQAGNGLSGNTYGLV